MATHTMHCPTGRRHFRGEPYANLIDDCFYCKHFIATMGGETEHGREPEYALCTAAHDLGSVCIGE